MTKIPISRLPQASSVAANNELPIVQSGVTKKALIEDVGKEVNTTQQYSDLNTTDKTPIGAINEVNSEVSEKADASSLATVATSGNYNDLSNKPSIPAAQVNSDWNANSGISQILNKPNLATVATSGDYNDLNNKPSVAVIDDTQASDDKTYSSNKINAVVSGLIDDSEASANKAYSSDKVANLIDGVQDMVDSFTFIRSVASENLNDEVYEYGRFNAAGDEYNSDVPITTAFRTKNYLPVVGGKTLEWYGFVNSPSLPSALPMQMVQYDENKNKISTRQEFYRIGLSGQSVKSLTLDNDCAFVRFDFYISNITLSNVKVSLYYSEDAKEEYTPYYEPYSVRCVDYDKVKENTTPYESVDDKTKQAIYTQFYGKKIAYNGDSICEGSGSFVGAYAKMVAELTGGTYFNNAVGGGHLAVYSDRHIICETVSEMPDDADLICFEGGINDYWGNCVIGSLTSGYTDAIDTTTLMGALESIFRQAIAKWVGKPICFIIVHKVRGTDTTPNSNGDTFTDFHDAIVEACNKYSIPYLDMFLYSGMNCNIQTIAENYTMASSSGQWGVDGCHPTEDGYKVYYISKILEFFKKQLSMY